MFFDLENRLRTDGQFRHELRRRQDRLARLDQLLLRHPGQRAQYHEALKDLLEFCRFNFALLTPYFWPAYPKSKPLLYSNYPFAFQMFNLQLGGFTVIRGSRQISKSTALACRQQMIARLVRGFRSLYIAPRHEQLQTYQNKYRELEKANRFFQRNTHLRQNLGYKEHDNGSIIEMASVLTSAAGIRGKSTDELLMDEYSHFDPELELEVLQTQSASEMKITVYAGTSLTSDSALEARWCESSQASWMMKCSSCAHHNIPLPEYGVMDMIQVAGPCCVKCGKLLNVRAGEFVHAFPRLRDTGYLGFHIPQLIVPAVVYNPARWADIYRMKNRVGGSRQFQQEVLGIATEEGEKEITRRQLEAICILGSDLQRLRLKAVQGSYRWVVSGCDWGGSDYIPELRMNKSESISLVFEAIRKQRIRCFAWEIAQEYLQDCLNLFRAPGEGGQSSSGMTTFIYRSHPTRPNDTLMALNCGFTLGRLLLGEPMLADLSVKLRLEEQLEGLSVDYSNLPGAISG